VRRPLNRFTKFSFFVNTILHQEGSSKRATSVEIDQLIRPSADTRLRRSKLVLIKCLYWRERATSAARLAERPRLTNPRITSATGGGGLLRDGDLLRGAG
jgi:hypothetical protein